MRIYETDVFLSDRCLFRHIIAALGLDEISQQLKDDLVDQLNTNDGSSSVTMTSQFSAESGKETATQFSVKSTRLHTVC